MGEQNRLIALSRESIRTNRFHFEKMSLRSQKIFLLPLTKLYWGMQDNPSTHPIHISFTRDEIREWLGIRADNEHFGSEFRRYFAEMVMESWECDKRAYEDAYKRYFPIKIHDFIGEQVIFSVEPISAFTQLGRRDTYVNPFVAFDVMEITKYKTAHGLRLLLAVMQTISQENPHQFSATTKELKEIFGLGLLDYCTISGEKPEFMREYAPFYEAYKKCSRSYEGVDVKRLGAIRKKYGFESFEEMVSYFETHISDIHFERTRFEQRVLLPAIQDINAGSMIKFVERTVKTRYGFDRSYFKKCYARSGNAAKPLNYKSVEKYEFAFTLQN